MIARSQFPGRSRPPKGRAEYSSRTMHREATPVRSSLSAGRAWCAAGVKTIETGLACAHGGESLVAPQHTTPPLVPGSWVANPRSFGRWLDDVVAGRVTTIAELCAREKCLARAQSYQGSRGT